MPDRASVEVNNNGDFSPGKPGDAGSLDLAGVCGYEGASVGASSANTFTAYGDVAGVCDDSGSAPSATCAAVNAHQVPGASGAAMGNGLHYDGRARARRCD